MVGFQASQNKRNVNEIGDGKNVSKAITCACGLIVSVVMLVFFGLTMLYSTSYGQVGSEYFSKQLLWAAIGFAAALTVIAVGYKILSDKSIFLVAVTFVLLVACLAFPEVKGAQRWIRFAGISLQPSELAKPVLVLFLAGYCAKHFRTVSEVFTKHGIFWALLVCGVLIGGVLLGQDLGTSMLMAAVALTVIFVAGAGLRWFFLAIAGGGALFLALPVISPVRWQRVTSFLEPEKVASDEGWQLWNSLMALGSGKWLGVGFMASRMKARYLPEAHTDFILAVVGEELGLVSLILVMLTYIAFTFFGLGIAMSARTRQGMFLAVGLTAVIALQAVINIGVVSGALPTKGISAPMISYGGSNLLSCMISAGLLLSVALDTIMPDYNKNFRERIFARFRKSGR